MDTSVTNSSGLPRIKGRMPINRNRHYQDDIYTRPNVRLPKSSHESPVGQDVVDNVLSKPCPRRQSIDQLISNDECEYSSDDAEMISKSLPARLPSCFVFSSDDFNVNSLSEDSSPAIFHRAQVNNKHRARSRAPETIHRNHQPHKDTSSHCKIIVPVLIIIIPILLSCLCCVFRGNESNVNNLDYTERHYQEQLEMFTKKYGIQNDDIILQLITGLDTINKSNNTGSFIFAYRSDIPGFHKSTFNNFVNDVAEASALYMRNRKPLVLEGNDLLNINSHSEVIIKHRDTLEKTGIMIIKQMENIPSVAAMAFHYFCDEYDPLVRRSAIFFTLDLDKCDTQDRRPTHHNIEQCLIDKWSNIPPNNMGPLLTRVVSVILDLTEKLDVVR